MDLNLRGRTALITGGSRGIGRAAALVYAREGANVAITYFSDEQSAAAVVGEIEALGAKGLAVRLDLADVQSTRSAVNEVLGALGSIDVLVANAVQWPTPAAMGQQFEDVAVPEWAPALRVNLEGTIVTVQAALPALRESSCGRIVLVSSDVARRGFPGSAVYGASKAALLGLTNGLITELRGDVLVNIVSPGLTVTERNLEQLPDVVREQVIAETPTRRLSTPEDIASAIAYLGSPANMNITGEWLSVTGGI